MKREWLWCGSCRVRVGGEWRRRKDMEEGGRGIVWGEKGRIWWKKVRKNKENKKFNKNLKIK